MSSKLISVNDLHGINSVYRQYVQALEDFSKAQLIKKIIVEYDSKADETLHGDKFIGARDLLINQERVKVVDLARQMYDRGVEVNADKDLADRTVPYKSRGCT